MPSSDTKSATYSPEGSATFTPIREGRSSTLEMIIAGVPAAGGRYDWHAVTTNVIRRQTRILIELPKRVIRRNGVPVLILRGTWRGRERGGMVASGKSLTQIGQRGSGRETSRPHPRFLASAKDSR